MKGSKQTQSKRTKSRTTVFIVLHAAVLVEPVKKCFIRVHVGSRSKATFIARAHVCLVLRQTFSSRHLTPETLRLGNIRLEAFSFTDERLAVYYKATIFFDVIAS